MSDARLSLAPVFVCHASAKAAAIVNTVAAPVGRIGQGAGHT